MGLPVQRAFGQFTAASTPAAVNLDMGFVPDRFVMIGESSVTTDIVKIEHLSSMGSGKCQKTVGAGTVTFLTTGGIATYQPAGTIKPNRWVASTAYALGDVVHPVLMPAAGYPAGNQSMPLYKCTAAGTSNSTEPTWPSTIGSTVTDSGVTWTMIDSGLQGSSEQKMLTGEGVTVPAALQSASVVYDWIAEGRQPT